MARSGDCAALCRLDLGDPGGLLRAGLAHWRSSPTATVQGQSAGRAPDQPAAQGQQAEVADDLGGVRGLAGSHLDRRRRSSRSRCSARARPPRRPRDEDEQQDRRRDSDGRVNRAGEQQQAERDLQERQPPADDRSPGPSGSSSYARTAATDACGSTTLSAPAVSSTPPSSSRAAVEIHGQYGLQAGPCQQAGAHRDRSTSSPKSCLRSAIGGCAGSRARRRMLGVETDHLRGMADVVAAAGQLLHALDVHAHRRATCLMVERSPVSPTKLGSNRSR